MDPEPSPIDVLADAGNQGRQHEHHGAEEQQVAVAVEIPGATDDQKRGDIQPGSDQGPGGLQLCSDGVPADDFDVTNPVEQCGEGEEDSARMGDEPAVRSVDAQG